MVESSPLKKIKTKYDVTYGTLKIRKEKDIQTQISFLHLDYVANLEKIFPSD